MAMHFSEEDQKKLREDSSEIYKKRTAESTKTDVKNLDRKGKIRYFLDYYLKFVIAGIVVIAILITVLSESLKKKPEEVLYIALRCDMMESEHLKKLSSAVEDYFQVDKKKEQVVVDLCSSDVELQTYLFANTVDVVIMDEEIFQSWGNSDYFYTAEEDSLVSFYQDYDEKYRFRAQRLTAEDRVKMEEDKKAKPADPSMYTCALYLTDSEKWNQLSIGLKNPVVAISKGTKHKKKAVGFIKYMMDNDIKME